MELSNHELILNYDIKLHVFTNKEMILQNWLKFLKYSIRLVWWPSKGNAMFQASLGFFKLFAGPQNYDWPKLIVS